MIPDIYNRLFLKELVNLLLNQLGFGGCFLLQDHVAATFGAGLGAACVVDLGDQKTSVSCVEDALSQRATRVKTPHTGVSISFPNTELHCRYAWITEAAMLHSPFTTSFSEPVSHTSSADQTNRWMALYFRDLKKLTAT